MNLIDQRCANHALREAAVQCPSCKRYFCRECVTEHQGRMMCVSCVTVLSRGGSKTARTAATIWSITAIIGILIAWLMFYYLGQTLAKIPAEFHGAWNRPAEKVPGADRSCGSRLCFCLSAEPRPAGAVFRGFSA
jgi:hypothetical protein